MIKAAIDSLDKSKLSDNNVMKRIKSFRDEVNNNKAISRSDVLSIEEFVGLPIITVHTHANKFTSVRSLSGVDEAIVGMDILINDFVPTELFTYDELAFNIIDVQRKLNTVLSHLKAFKIVPKENIDRLSNEKIVYEYRDEQDKEGNDLIDITKTVIIGEMFMYRNDYLSGCVGTDVFDRIKNTIVELASDNQEAFKNNYTPLLSILAQNVSLWDVYAHRPYITDDVHIVDVINMYNNIDKHIETVTSFLENVGRDYSDIIVNESWYVTCSKESYIGYFRGYKLLKNILSDDLSMGLLRLLSYFK